MQGPKIDNELVEPDPALVDARMRREILRLMRRPKARRMLKLAKKAQDKGDNEIAEMWVRRALK